MTGTTRPLARHRSPNRPRGRHVTCEGSPGGKADAPPCAEDGTREQAGRSQITAYAKPLQRKGKFFAGFGDVDEGVEVGLTDRAVDVVHGDTDGDGGVPMAGQASAAALVACSVPRPCSCGLQVV